MESEFIRNSSARNASVIVSIFNDVIGPGHSADVFG
jgi:hypothetical protein